jgi:hypothetical protein
MPSVGFEPTIAAFVRAKTIHALDRAATVIGNIPTLITYKKRPNSTIYCCEASEI